MKHSYYLGRMIFRESVFVIGVFTLFIILLFSIGMTYAPYLSMLVMGMLILILSTVYLILGIHRVKPENNPPINNY